MNNNFVFSWAENAEGKIVHVDSVPRGCRCGCNCPHCHEPLLARHGEKNEHCFAHHSETRGANLKICYMVILYKLAEQIIQTKKRIHAPSYYDIFKEKEIEFVDVKVDSRYEREDKQPDVIAITDNGTQYLIEFIFDYKVQHKQPIDYKNLNCLEINLSGQSLETVEKFLLESNTNRKWLNNQYYFNNIVNRYQKADKVIEIKDEEECELCELKYSCSGVKSKDYNAPLIIENSGHSYRICKSEQYRKDLELYRKRLEEEERKKEAERQRQRELELEWERNRQKQEQKRLLREQQKAEQQTEFNAQSLDSSERTCFKCQSNLSWKNKPGDKYAYCACYLSVRVPQNTPPESALTCSKFQRKKTK